jgi:hypothetical protein
MMNNDQDSSAPPLAASVHTDFFESIVQRKMAEGAPPVTAASPPEADSGAPGRRHVSFKGPHEPEEEEEPTPRRGPRKLFKRKSQRESGRPAEPAPARKRKRKRQMRGAVPRFFRNPDDASEEEKHHLRGPFYVVWPKHKTMPRSSEALRYDEHP